MLKMTFSKARKGTTKTSPPKKHSPQNRASQSPRASKPQGLQLLQTRHPTDLQGLFEAISKGQVLQARRQRHAFQGLSEVPTERQALKSLRQDDFLQRLIEEVAKGQNP